MSEFFYSAETEKTLYEWAMKRLPKGCMGYNTMAKRYQRFLEARAKTMPLL